MNEYFGSYNRGYNYTAPPAPTFNPTFQPTVPQLRTNKVFVTSLEDALNRYAEPNTIMVYRHQDEKFEYEVMTDMQGKKTYKTLALSEYSGVEPQKNDGGVVISVETIDALDKRISALESELLKKANKKGGTSE